MFTETWFLLCISFLQFVCMESQSLHNPRIITRPTTYTAKVGDSIELECGTSNLGSMVLLWKEGPRVLFAGSMKVRRDSRLELRGTNLVIQSLEKKDEGRYDCEIEVDKSRIVSIRHQLQILVPPSVSSEPSGREVLVERGNLVSVHCRGAGTPAPSITWTRLNYAKILGEGGTLKLLNVSREEDGVYVCTADNGIGAPASVHISIQVLYKPEISVESSVVHGGLGFQAVLVCRIQSQPVPDVRWYRGTMLLETDNDRYMETVGSMYSLVISKLRLEDFTFYSCSAGNRLGVSSANITISGTPGVPKLQDRINQEGSGHYKLGWSTFSYSDILHYTLLYRKVLDARLPDKIYPWTSILIPGAPKGQGAPSGGQDTPSGPPSLSVPATPLHRASFLLSHIEDRAEYEVRVRAKNMFGWSEVSDTFRFPTSSVETMPVESPRMDVSSQANQSFLSLSALYLYWFSLLM